MVSLPSSQQAQKLRRVRIASTFRDLAPAAWIRGVSVVFGSEDDRFFGWLTLSLNR